MNQCIKCNSPITSDAKTGRPASYCSIACRRSAELEIRRLDRQIDELEKDRISEQRNKSSERDFKNAFGQGHAERLAALELALVEAEARLKILLSAKSE